MANRILVIGGARSGKSAHAEQRALALGDPLYIATAEPVDDEMARRVAEHAARRGPRWRLAEAPLDLPGAIRASEGGGPRLVDCLTVWLGNLMHHGRAIEPACEALVAAVREARAPLVLVASEVGGGIVPENAQARAFRDAAGRLNQSVAAACDTVVLVTAGLPLTLKNTP